MESPWQLPLPQGEYATSRVVVYFYRGDWIPITFYPLTNAINLHQGGLLSGIDILLFPLDLDPRFYNPTTAVFTINELGEKSLSLQAS